MRDSFQSELASADPIAEGEDTQLHDLVRRMTRAAQAEATIESRSPAPWWRRRRTLIPLGIAGVVALTGAALVIPLNQLWIDGMTVDADVVIPVNYTTDTGVDVSCRYSIYYGDPADRSESDEQLAAFVADQDWTGIGQRIYEHAIANPFVPGRDGGLQFDTQQNRDQMSLSIAIRHEIEEIIPDHLRDTPEGIIESGLTDCQGKLH